MASAAEDVPVGSAGEDSWLAAKSVTTAVTIMDALSDGVRDVIFDQLSEAEATQLRRVSR